VGTAVVVVVGSSTVVDGTTEVEGLSVGVVGPAPAIWSSLCAEASTGTATATVATTAPPARSPARRRTRRCRIERSKISLAVSVEGTFVAPFRHPGGASWSGRGTSVPVFVIELQLFRNLFVVFQPPAPQAQPGPSGCCRKDPGAPTGALQPCNFKGSSRSATRRSRPSIAARATDVSSV
jgi:hypothetical protein